MLKTMVLAAVLAGVGLAHAQTAPAATGTKKELVAKVLQLQQPGIESLARTLAEQPAIQITQMAAAALQRVPQERREALARDLDADIRKYVEEALPIVRNRALQLAPTTIGPVLEERFSEDELRQLIAILESPVNRKFQQVAPEMNKALAERLVSDTRPQVEPKVRAMEQAVRTRLPAAAAAASGGRK